MHLTQHHQQMAEPATGLAVGGGGSAAVDEHQLRQVSHDLRLEVAAVGMAVAALRVDPALTFDLGQRLQQIESQCSRLSRLIEVSLVEPAPAEPVSVVEVVRECIEVARLSSDADILLEAEPAVVVMDWSALRRMCMNLLDNAVRAAGPSGRLRVKVDVRDGAVRIDVEDSGPGFGAGPAGTSQLGLSVVHDVVDRYGGRVQISISDLGGAGVRVILPIAGGT